MAADFENRSVSIERKHSPESNKLSHPTAVNLEKGDNNKNCPNERKPSSSPRLMGKDGKSKMCEMSCPFTKRVMKVFSSLSEAGRETNISTIPIGKVCQVGGGIVEGRYFRYVNDNKEDIAKSHLEDTTNGQPLEIVHQLEKHESERVQSDKSKRTETSFRNDRNCRDDDESVQNSLISLQQESQKEVYTSQGKKSIPRKRKRVKNVDTLAKKKVHLVEDNPQEIPKDNMKSNSISEVQTNIGSQMVHRSVKYPDSSIQNTSTPSDAPEGCFDLTTLRPSTSLPSEKKKMVELICKGRSEVVVCFRGYSAAANALGLDRSQISLMCENNYEPSALQTYSLRLTSNKSPQSAYEYGCHDEDFVENSETYTERLERFRTTYELEVQSEYELANGTTEEVPIVSLGGTTTINPLTPVSLRNKNQLLNEKYQGICIICQTSRAQVVFEPCLHNLLCIKCHEKGLCKTFCPFCRMEIQSIVQPSFLRLVRPRIYSAYSFM